jgi:heat shock protein HtpX
MVRKGSPVRVRHWALALGIPRHRADQYRVKNRYDLPTAVRTAELSTPERISLFGGIVAVAAAAIGVRCGGDPGGTARLIALPGLAAILCCGVSRAVRLYLAGVDASLPTSVARVHVRARPARAFNATTVTLALLLPLAAAVAVLALVAWAWLPVAGVLLVGGVAIYAAWARADSGKRPYTRFDERASELLGRLCIRADMRIPELVIEGSPRANAWTAAGRVHVTPRLLELLDDAELEAVLAHEVAHLAHRDAAVMEICSAPSRVLLAFARSLPRWLVRSVRGVLTYGRFGAGMWLLLVALAVLCVPPAFVIGSISRLSVLGMSRAREYSADAAATTLTGRPSALASALMKLEHQREWTPRSDLREAYADAVLCIVGISRQRLGRLISTHPPIAVRVKRLEETESRIQAGPYGTRHL